MRAFLITLMILFSVPLAHAETSRLENITNVLDAFDRNLSKSMDSFLVADVAKKQEFGRRRAHILEVGYEPYYYQYWEVIKVKISGMMNSFYANYVYRPEDSNPLNNIVFNAYRLEFRYARGDLDYKSESGIDKGIFNDNLELRALLQKEYPVDGNAIVTPYLGFGYRTLYDQQGGRLTNLGYYGYDRRSTYYYLPIGTSAVLRQGPWCEHLNFEYDFLINGTQISDFSNGTQYTGFSNPNIHNHQSNGFGLRGSFRIGYSVPKFDIYVEPFFRYWNIRQSNVVNATVDGSNGDWVEPHNTTKEIGSKIGLQF